MGKFEVEVHDKLAGWILGVLFCISGLAPLAANWMILGVFACKVAEDLGVSEDASEPVHPSTNKFSMP